MGLVTAVTACLLAWTRLPDSYICGGFGIQVHKAKTDVKVLQEAVGTYQKRSGRLPSGLLELTAQDGRRDPLISELTMDPWNNDYQLVIETPSKWKVVSWGPDGSEGGGDDISSEKEES